MNSNQQTRAARDIYWTLIALIASIYAYISINSLNITYHSQLHLLGLAITIFAFNYFLSPIKNVPTKDILLSAIFLSSILVLAPLKIYTDTTAYILPGRVFVYGKLNPYQTSYIEFKTDNLYALFENYHWAKTVPTLSPFFTYISIVFVWLSGGNFFINQTLFKLLFWGAFICSVLLLKRITKNREALYLYALNPIVVYELVKENHAESLVIALTAAAIFLIKRNQIDKSLVATAVSSLIKVSYLIFLPIIFIHNLHKSNRRFKKAIQLITIVAILYLLTYIPFFKDSIWFKQISDRIIHSNNDIFSLNYVVLLFFLITKYFRSGFVENYILASKLNTGVGMLLYSGLIAFNLKKLKRISGVVFTTTCAYLVYLFFILNYFMPYYSPMGIFLLSVNYAFNKRSVLNLVIPLLTVYTLLYYSIM